MTVSVWPVTQGGVRGLLMGAVVDMEPDVGAVLGSRMSKMKNECLLEAVCAVSGRHIPFRPYRKILK